MMEPQLYDPHMSTVMHDGYIVTTIQFGHVVTAIWYLMVMFAHSVTVTRWVCSYGYMMDTLLKLQDRHVVTII